MFPKVYFPNEFFPGQYFEPLAGPPVIIPDFWVLFIQFTSDE